MSTSLFARLAQKHGPRVDAATRRQFLAATLATTAGLMLSRNFSFAQAPRKNAPRVAVIGAGFSGLACAYELLAAGYDVTVIEARNRVGGRVLSFTDWIQGRNVEGGGELIGSNHPTWVAYAQLLGLEFIDVTELKDAEFPVVFDGKRLTTEESAKLYEEMEAALAKMNEAAAKVNGDEPWKSPDAEKLDKQTLQTWIDAMELSPLCKKGVSVQLAADNGQDPKDSSYLGMLTQIKGGGVEKYWTESEVYRCKGGNQQLAFKLAEKIGKDRIVLGLPVSDVVQKNNAITITCKDGRTIEVDDVVLTAVPSTWKKINFSPPIPASMSPQMGVNVKYLSHLKQRFWLEKKLAPDALTDGVISMTWEGTDSQTGEGDVELTAFSGGPQATAARERSKEDRQKVYHGLLNQLYPGFEENFVDSRFMDWPGDPWTMAGYSFPAPGQVTTVGPALRKGIGRMHFAGEHTCYQFVGYMEGGLNSGASLARRLAVRDGLFKPSTQPATNPTSAPA